MCGLIRRILHLGCSAIVPDLNLSVGIFLGGVLCIGSIQIKGDYANRVFCVADVSILSKHLRLNKESFEKNQQTGKCRNKIKESFWKFLEHEGLLRKERVNSDTNVVVNELTKKLDVLLNKKEFRELNPFLNPRNRVVPVPDENEGFAVSETNEDNITSGADDNTSDVGGI